MGLTGGVLGSILGNWGADDVLAGQRAFWKDAAT